jgi:hypothetical protein
MDTIHALSLYYKNIYARYTQDMSMKASAADYVLTYFTTPKGPRRWSSSPGRVKDSPFSTSSRLALGPPSLFQWVTEDLSSGVRREADHSPPASAEVKKTWIYTSTLPYVFMT